MVTPFLTLQQLSVLLARPSASRHQDSQAPLSAVERFLQSDEEEQGRVIAMMAGDPSGAYNRIA